MTPARLPVPRHAVPLDPPEVWRAIATLAGRRADPAQVAAFEERFARYLGARAVLGVASGRRAFALGLRALGLKTGSRIGLPAYCFQALVRVVEAYGHEPVFLPIDPGALALDPEGVVAHAGRLDAVTLIQPFGQVADVFGVVEACEERGIPLIEDASQSTGAAMGGRQVGTFGRLGVFSMVSGKNLHGFGGGALVTDDEVLRERAAALAGPPVDRGMPATFRGELVRAFLSSRSGFVLGPYPALRTLAAVAPGRFAALFDEADAPFDAHDPLRRMAPEQAALAILNLQRLDERNLRRRLLARRLRHALGGVGGLTLQAIDPRAIHTFNAFPVRVADGLRFARALLRHGVDVRRDYMTWYGGPPAFPEDVVYLPCHPGMTEDDVDHVAQAVQAVLA